MLKSIVPIHSTLLQVIRVVTFLTVFALVSATTQFKPAASAKLTPILGNYPSTTITKGANAVILSDRVPVGTSRINVATDSDFKGTLVADLASGDVRVTNAHPAGTYTVTVKALDNNSMASTTFQLTVVSGTVCNGTIRFTNGIGVATGVNPFNVAIGDFNNDGKQDLATANGGGAVSVRLGNGSGGFGGTTEVSVGTFPRSVAVGDFNNDGNLDLATANQLSNSVSIRLGDGVLTKLPNLPSLNGMNLKAALTDRFSLPVTLENGATAAAIGENWLGASKGVDDSILITLGTGVGGGVIINGEPHRGKDGTADEIGHICVEPDGHPCGCGSHGCVKQYACATAIVRMAKESGLEITTSLEVYESAQRGDEIARSVFQKMGRYLGITLAGLVNTLNPEMIVLGGGVAAGMDAFIEPLKAEILARAFREPAERAKIVRSELGDNAGFLGAARSAFLNDG